MIRVSSGRLLVPEIEGRLQAVTVSLVALSRCPQLTSPGELCAKPQIHRADTERALTSAK